MSNWFTGETKTLKAESLRKAADFLRCSRDWLETGVGSPGWLDGEQLNTHMQAVATLTPNLTTSPAPAPTIEQALPVVLAAITALPAARWASVRAQLDQLAQHPEMRDDVATELLSLLRPAADAGKRSAE